MRALTRALDEERRCNLYAGVYTGPGKKCVRALEVRGRLHGQRAGSVRALELDAGDMRADDEGVRALKEHGRLHGRRAESVRVLKLNASAHTGADEGLFGR